MDGIINSLNDVQSNFDCCLSGDKEIDSHLIASNLQRHSNCSNPNASRADGKKFHELKSCHDRFTYIWRSLLLFTSCSLSISSLLFLLISPLIYSIFEFDARLERFHSISLWQRKMRRQLEDERK
ncbi:hypothetical protein PMAYCL1PPCAC_29054, partial [Pristionchus mayeri]